MERSACAHRSLRPFLRCLTLPSAEGKHRLAWAAFIPPSGIYERGALAGMERARVESQGVKGAGVRHGVQTQRCSRLNVNGVAEFILQQGMH